MMNCINYGIMKSKEEFIKKNLNKQKCSDLSFCENNLICISTENNTGEEISFTELYLSNVSGECYTSLSSESIDYNGMDEIVITC